MVRSGVWGNSEANVTNPFGYNSPNIPDSWYLYAADWGYPAGTHIGVDIGVEKGTPIYAVADGTVIQEGEDLQSFRPNPVWIETPDDPSTPDDETEHHIYGHLWSDVVSPGQQIKKGQLIGYSGEQTVRGTWDPDGSGPHLHFERRDISESRALDPMPLLDGSFSPVDGGPVVEASKIDALIASKGGGPLAGKGQVIIDIGVKYGINPAVAVAMMMRETQLGTDGSEAPRHNNFGWNKGIPGQVEGDAGLFNFGGNTYQAFSTPDAGIEGWYKVLDKDIYRDTGGKLIDVLSIYAPESDGNSHADGFRIFAAVGDALGVEIGPDTQVYSVGNVGRGSGSTSGGGGLFDVGPIIDAVREGAKRAGLGIAGIALLALGIIVIIGPGRVASLVPAGRVARAVTS